MANGKSPDKKDRTVSDRDIATMARAISASRGTLSPNAVRKMINDALNKGFGQKMSDRDKKIMSSAKKKNRASQYAPKKTGGKVKKMMGGGKTSKNMAKMVRGGKKSKYMAKGGKTSKYMAKGGKTSKYMSKMARGGKKTKYMSKVGRR